MRAKVVRYGSILLGVLLIILSIALNVQNQNLQAGLTHCLDLVVVKEIKESAPEVKK